MDVKILSCLLKIKTLDFPIRYVSHQRNPPNLILPNSSKLGNVYKMRNTITKVCHMAQMLVELLLNMLLNKDSIHSYNPDLQSYNS
jgi:hypothetical protein